MGGGGKSMPFSSQEEVSFPRGESAELQRLRGLERAGKSFRAALRTAKWEKTEDSGGTSGRCPFSPADPQLRSEGRCRAVAVAVVRSREEKRPIGRRAFWWAAAMQGERWVRPAGGGLIRGALRAGLREPWLGAVAWTSETASLPGTAACRRGGRSPAGLVGPRGSRRPTAASCEGRPAAGRGGAGSRAVRAGAAGVEVGALLNVRGPLSRGRASVEQGRRRGTPEPFPKRVVCKPAK